MRLIDTWTFALEEFDEDAIPEYAILSHTWGDDEVSYAEMKHLESARERKAFAKIARAAELAVDESLRWIWIDTCCIDKSSSAELQEAINSMWRWYSNTAICYVFMSDLPRNIPYLTDDGAYRHPNNKRTLSIEGSEYPAMFEKFTGARWFSRGWCLQELIAPKTLRFYSVRPNSSKCRIIGEKSRLVRTISEATKIDTAILEHKLPLSSMSVAQRMSWASHRHTRRVEDQAYSLLGIFDVSMPMLYGEGKRAFIRLQEEIMRTNSDHSLFAWGRNNKPSSGSLLATSPDDFAEGSRVVQWGHSKPFEMTNRGLRISLPLLSRETAGTSADLGILNCRYNDSLDHSIALRLDSKGGTLERHVAVTHGSYASFHGTDPQVDRLAMVYAGDMKLATTSEMLITRTYEPRSSSVRFMLHLDSTRADRSHKYVDDVYTEQDSTVPSAPVFLTTRKPVARAGVMLQYPSGRRFSLVFGFDRYPPNDSNGVLLPGVWAKFHRGPQRLKDIIKLEEPIHTHGRRHTCKDPREDGCPYMPKMAHVALHPEGDILDASIEHELIFEEDVFVVQAIIKQEYEMAAPEESMTGEVAAGARASSNTAIDSARVENKESFAMSTPLAPETLRESHDPFVPDIRHSILTVRGMVPSEYSAAISRRTRHLPRSDESALEGASPPHSRGTPSNSGAQSKADATNSNASVNETTSSSPRTSNAFSSVANWAFCSDRGHTNGPDVEAQLLNPLSPEDQNNFDGFSSGDVETRGDRSGDSRAEMESQHAPSAATPFQPMPFYPEVQAMPTHVRTARGEVFQSAGASEAYVPEVHIGVVGNDGFDDFCIEEID